MLGISHLGGKKKGKIEGKKEKSKQSQYLIFFEVSMDLIQDSTAPHSPPQGSTGELSLPWKPAEERARSSDLEEALSFKGLYDPSG